MNTASPETRIAILARMTKQARITMQVPNQRLGRTQVMKLLYFLQELKGIPLGYDFRLFNYGPFDSEVLSDLSLACSSNAIVEETVLFNAVTATTSSLERKLTNSITCSNRKVRRLPLPLTRSLENLVI